MHQDPAYLYPAYLAIRQRIRFSCAPNLSWVARLPDDNPFKAEKERRLAVATG
jgi:hypothetical protein